MNAPRPQKIPTIKWAMTPFPWHIDIDEGLEEAKRTLSVNAIHHLPVTEAGELVGMLHARDVHLMESAAVEPDQRKALTVRDLCVRNVHVVETSERLDRVLLEMARRQLDSVLVVKNEKLAGIFTATDACRGFGDFLVAMFPEGEDDDVA